MPYRRKRKARYTREVVADLPPEHIRQVPTVYNADTGQRVGGRYQRWANQFPLGQGAEIRLRFGAPENATPEMQRGAYTVDGDTVYINPKAFRRGEGLAQRQLFHHELAHRYDYRSGNDALRQRFSQIMGYGDPWAIAGSSVPSEQFADAVAQYTTSRRYTGGSSAYGYRPTRKQWRQTRRLFDGLK